MVIATVVPPGTAVPTVTVDGTAIPLVPGQTGTMGEYSVDLSGVATDGADLDMSCVFSPPGGDPPEDIPFFFEDATVPALTGTFAFAGALRGSVRLTCVFHNETRGI